jgi:hypothetical protein
LVVEDAEQDVDDLQNQPRGADVADRYAEYAATLEFAE